MKDIIIYTSHGIVKTKIPEKYISDDLILYWIDSVCKENVNDWYDYKIL